MAAGISAILGTAFGTEAMNGAFDDRAQLRGMLAFEAALAVAAAAEGIVPADAAIAEKCVAALYDLDEDRPADGVYLGAMAHFVAAARDGWREALAASRR